MQRGYGCKMKRVGKIIGNDGETKVEVVVKFEQKANWESERVTSDFNYLLDSLVNAVATKFHLNEISIK